MNTQKFVLSGIAGGIANFFAGWLLYGMLLSDFMMKNAGSASGVMRAETEMIWWALILGSMFSGFLLSYIFNKYAAINTLTGGAAAGFIILLMVGGSYDFMCYGTSNLMTLTGVLVDIIVVAVMGAITGAVVGLVNGILSKKA